MEEALSLACTAPCAKFTGVDTESCWTDTGGYDALYVANRPL
jgi:pimeloyl-CoA synthetase